MRLNLRPILLAGCLVLGAFAAIPALPQPAQAAQVGSDLLTILDGLSFADETFSGSNTQTVYTGEAILKAIVVGTPTATAVLKVYDNTAGSGTLVSTIDASKQPGDFDVLCKVGITLVDSVASPDVTVIYRAVP
ncbi:MAG: hypothetical protein KGR26_06125 [Cyanobacteria bacterium REEB65]|nr:hypothetical protein [Cyanobacteria bacterium REEB65]